MSRIWTAVRRIFRRVTQAFRSNHQEVNRRREANCPQGANCPRRVRWRWLLVLILTVLITNLITYWTDKLLHLWFG